MAAQRPQRRAGAHLPINLTNEEPLEEKTPIAEVGGRTDGGGRSGRRPGRAPRDGRGVGPGTGVEARRNGLRADLMMRLRARRRLPAHAKAALAEGSAAAFAKHR